MARKRNKLVVRPEFSVDIVLCCGSNKSIEVFDMNVGRSVRVIMDAHTRPVHTICQNQV